MSPVIISQYFFPEPTGSAPPITDLALWLAEQGHEPAVVTARPNYPDRVVFEGYRQGERDREVWSGIHVRRLASLVTRGSGLFGRLITEGSFLLALCLHRVSRRASNSVISVCPSIFVALGASLFVAPAGRHLVIVHDVQSGLGKATGASGSAMQALRLLERYALNRADVIVTLSSGMAEAIRELGVRTPVIVAPPQLDVHKFKVLPEPANPTVVYSGAMGRKQGLHQILAAAEVLKTRDSEIQIVIRGQGGIKDELVTLAHSKNLTNVRFEPLAPFDQLNEAMASGHIHLVPQASDGADFAVPSKIFSIMACGRPFIATAHAESPLADLAEQSGSGVVVTPDDPFALADAITSLMKSESTRLNYGANGRRYVERCVDRSVVCEKIWDALINKSVAVNRIGTEAV